jgi:hypothetical protein
VPLKDSAAVSQRPVHLGFTHRAGGIASTLKPEAAKLSDRHSSKKPSHKYLLTFPHVRVIGEFTARHVICGIYETVSGLLRLLLEIRVDEARYVRLYLQ